jgi:tartrate-resistant acid phosphatase type 5
MTTLSRRRLLKTAFCSSASLALNLSPRDVLAADSVSGDQEFILLGDYGSNQPPQTAVAKGMRAYVEQLSLKPKAMFLLGDNFYTKGLDSVKSVRWTKGFEDMYPKSHFDCPCYAILGNHDYHDNKGGEKIQMAYAKQGGTRWTMPAKWYRQEFGDLITLINIDTNLRSISSKPDAKAKVKTPKPSLTEAEETEQWAWLKTELAKPRGKFTIIAGHHPVYSNGYHGDSKELVAKLAPLMQEHGVHVYVCGHDHDMQHLELEGQKTTFILSGGGGARVREIKHKDRKMPYFKAVYGFSHLSANADRLLIRHLDANGKQIHAVEKKADFTWKAVA